MSDNNCCNVELTLSESPILTLDALGDSYIGEMPTMSTTQKGGAKVGAGLEVDSDEFLNIAPSGVVSEMIDNAAITTEKLADGAVTADKIADASITPVKLSNSVLDMFDGNVKAFDTVAGMQADSNLQAGDICHTNGFHSAGDGGAAFYKITASGTTNGMDVLACGDVFANFVITESYVTPEMFGAWGDGATDDASAINRAIVYASVNDISVKLISIYAIESTINVNYPISVYGDGTIGRYKGSTSDYYCGFTTGFLQKFSGVGINVVKSGAYGQVFKGGTFNGFGIIPDSSLYEDSNCIGIQVDAMSHLIFDTVAVLKYENGTGIDLRNGGQYLNFVNCLFDANKYGIKTTAYEADTVQFFGGCNLSNCYFDCNGNGTLYNSNPKEGSYGLYLDNTGSWFIDQCRFQGIEYCIYVSDNGNSAVVISDSRFEMFTYGIYTAGDYVTVNSGNMFDGYLGTSGRTKIAIYIAETANYTKISGKQNITSCNYIPIKDYGSNTVRDDILHISILVAQISASSFIPLGVANCYGVISNMQFRTGLLSSQGGFGNDSTNYWSFIPSGYSASDGLSTTGKAWGATSRYVPMTLIEKRNDSTNAHAVVLNNTITLYIQKHGTPETITNCLISFDFIPLANY